MAVGKLILLAIALLVPSVEPSLWKGLDRRARFAAALLVAGLALVLVGSVARGALGGPSWPTSGSDPMRATIGESASPQRASGPTASPFLICPR